MRDYCLNRNFIEILDRSYDRMIVRIDDIVSIREKSDGSSIVLIKAGMMTFSVITPESFRSLWERMSEGESRLLIGAPFLLWRQKRREKQ